jgi:hypothetical protein
MALLEHKITYFVTGVFELGGISRELGLTAPLFHRHREKVVLVSREIKQSGFV